jgi:hypothetical protein
VLLIIYIICAVLFVNDDILLPFKNLKGHYVLLFNNNKEKQTNTNNNKQTNQKIDNKKITITQAEESVSRTKANVFFSAKLWKLMENAPVVN